MPGRDSDSAVAAALWLVELQRVAVRGSHAIKNALNNVAVNLEVVRGRAQRADAAGAMLSRFAETAAGQLDAVTMLSEALLALTRPPREPVDVRATAMAIHALLREGRTGGDGLKNGTRYEGPATSRVPGVTVRLALAHVLLPAADDEPPAEWCVEMSGGAVPAALTFQVTRPSSAPGMDDEVEAVVRAAGVRVEHGTGTLTLSFPALAS